MPNSSCQYRGAPSALRLIPIYRRAVLALCVALLGFGTVWTFRPVSAGSTLVLYTAVGYAPQVARAFMKADRNPCHHY